MPVVIFRMANIFLNFLDSWNSLFCGLICIHNALVYAVIFLLYINPRHYCQRWGFFFFKNLYLKSTLRWILLVHSLSLLIIVADSQSRIQERRPRGLLSCLYSFSFCYIFSFHCILFVSFRGQVKVAAYEMSDREYYSNEVWELLPILALQIAHISTLRIKY